jgi:hypothetical protein
MSQSFTSSDALADASTIRRKVLVTGAAGNIGSYFAKYGHKRYDLRLMVRPGEDREDMKALDGYGEIVEADIEDLESMKRVCQGMDTVLHLAANPSPSAVWSSLLQLNIVGTYNTFVAAKAAGCRRLIYASSIHAVSGYPADYQVHTNDPVNPGDLYGVTKCFGEALGRYMAEKEGLSCIALRIGAFQPLDTARKPDRLDIADCFVSKRDLQQLIEKCIDAEELKFAIFHGLSNNRFKRLDITDARMIIGYDPVDDFTKEHPHLAPLHLADKVKSQSQADSGDKSGIREELTR